MLENDPLQVRQRLWFQHDGAPTHFALDVRKYLNVFPNRWIGMGGPVQWPPRSPDLTPMDFFIWGEMKCLVARVAETAAIIRERQSFARRYRLCINVNGRYFQQLRYCKTILRQTLQGHLARKRRTCQTFVT